MTLLYGGHELGLLELLLGPIAFGLWGAIIGALWEGIKWLAGKAADLALLLAAAARQAGHQIWNALKLLGRYSVKFAGWVRDGMDYLYAKYVKPITEALWKAAEKVSGMLRRVLGPVIDLVRKVQGWVLTLWTSVISPILEAIEAVRLVFQLLGRLGFEWAWKVDAWLANLEGRIVDAFGLVTGWINRILNWLFVITTPEGLIEPRWLWGSIEPHATTILHFLLKHGLDDFTIEERQEFISKYPPNMHADFQYQLETGLFARRPIGDVTHAIVERIFYRAKEST